MLQENSANLQHFLLHLSCYSKYDTYWRFRDVHEFISKSVLFCAWVGSIDHLIQLPIRTCYLVFFNLQVFCIQVALIYGKALKIKELTFFNCSVDEIFNKITIDWVVFNFYCQQLIFLPLFVLPFFLRLTKYPSARLSP